MARVSRKNKTSDRTVCIKDNSYRTAVYLRLSVEDNGKKEADSLENQRNLLVEYVSSRPYLELVEVYTDNGFSGTDFERPQFQRMMRDVQKGKINCIVVKDLSRLGRNYIEAGEYLEKVFPFLGIRFIAVNDGYDSAVLSSEGQLGATLKNVINDIYAKDISRKSSSALKAKRLKGEYIGKYAPYGYLRDPENKNHLIIDPDTAPIVTEIFQMRAEGMGIGSILRTLNKKGYPSPGRVRYERGIITNNNKKGTGLLWNRHVTTDILHNVVYIGHLAQGRHSSSLYKGIPYHRVEASQWDIVKNTHEPLISIKLWEQVQKVNDQRSNTIQGNLGKYSYLPKRENPYGSIFRCAGCGKVMKQVCSYNTSSKSGTKRYYSYKCPTNLEHGKEVCSQKGIRAEDLDNAVWHTIRKQMEVFLDGRKVLQELNILNEKERKNSETIRMNQIETQIEKKQNQIVSLYTDLQEGILTQDEYIYAKNTYRDELEMLYREAEEISSIRDKSEEVNKGIEKWNYFMNEYNQVEGVSSIMVESLIKEMRIYADSRISIEFKYADELERFFQNSEETKGGT